VGGDTIFVDTAAAWSGLSPALKMRLAHMRALHGRPEGSTEGEWKGGAVKAFRTVRRTDLRGRPEVLHPVMRTHPDTGEQHLYVNPTFTLGLEEDGTIVEHGEASALLSQLYTQMYSTPEYSCRFSWSGGSVAFWDNRACQHYACGDFWPHARRMERVTVLDRSFERRAPF
jgi:taurine dioxygenase